MNFTRKRQEELRSLWADSILGGYKIRDPDALDDWQDIIGGEMSLAEWEWCRSNLVVTRTVTVSLGDVSVVSGHVPGSRLSPGAAEQIKRHIEALQVALEDGTR